MIVNGAKKCPEAEVVGATACTAEVVGMKRCPGFIPLILCPCGNEELPDAPRIYIKAADAAARGISTRKVIEYTNDDGTWCYTIDPTFVFPEPPVDSTLIDITDPDEYPFKPDCLASCLCCPEFFVWTNNWGLTGTAVGAQGMPWYLTYTGGVLADGGGYADISIAGTGPWVVTDNLTQFQWTLPVKGDNCPDSEGVTLLAGVAIPKTVKVTWTEGGNQYVAVMTRDSPGPSATAGQSHYSWNGQHPLVSFVGADLVWDGGTGKYQLDFSSDGGTTSYTFKAVPTDIYGSVNTTPAAWTQTFGGAVTLDDISISDFFTPEFDHWKCVCLPTEECCISDGATGAVTITGISEPFDWTPDGRLHPDDTDFNAATNDIRSAAVDLIDFLTNDIGLPIEFTKTGTTSAGSCAWFATKDQVLPATRTDSCDNVAGAEFFFQDLVDRSAINALFYYSPNSHTEVDRNKGVWHSVFQFPRFVGAGDHPDLEVFEINTQVVISTPPSLSRTSEDYEHVNRPTSLAGGSGQLKMVPVTRKRFTWNPGALFHTPDCTFSGYYELQSTDHAYVDLDVTWAVSGNTKSVSAEGDCV